MLRLNRNDKARNDKASGTVFNFDQKFNFRPKFKFSTNI